MPIILIPVDFPIVHFDSSCSPAYLFLSLNYVFFQRTLICYWPNYMDHLFFPLLQCAYQLYNCYVSIIFVKMLKSKKAVILIVFSFSFPVWLYSLESLIAVLTPMYLSGRPCKYYVFALSFLQVSRTPEAPCVSKGNLWVPHLFEERKYLLLNLHHVLYDRKMMIIIVFWSSIIYVFFVC